MSKDKMTADLLRHEIPEPTEPAVTHSADRLRSWYRDRATPIDWANLDTPFGRLYLAAGPHGLIRVALRGDESTFLADLDGRARLQYRGERIREPLRALRAYFNQRRLTFNLPLDLHATSRFQRLVLETIQAIPPGQVWSYGEVAQRIGKPSGARAVGQALGANPIPIVIPCHRVVASEGRLGGYSGGLKVKEFLLRHEGAR